MIQIVPEALQHQGAIHEILEAGFGENRLKKTVYRIRAAAAPVSDLSLVAIEATGAVLGTLRFWPIMIAEAPALLLGPLAVADRVQGQGVGRALVKAALAKIDADHGLPVLLVGPPAYYAPFGFAPVETGTITLPGAFDPARLVLRPSSHADAATPTGLVAAGRASDIAFKRFA